MSSDTPESSPVVTGEPPRSSVFSLVSSFNQALPSPAQETRSQGKRDPAKPTPGWKAAIATNTAVAANAAKVLDTVFSILLPMFYTDFFVSLWQVSDFPTEGITLAGIRHLISLYGGEEVFTGLRTTDVCEKFLKPATVDQQESYCVAFKDDPTCLGHIAKATAFVSHAWGHEFLDVVAALGAYDATRSTPTVFWFDVFSNNQHKTAVRDFTWWQTVFRDNIGRLKRTLLVLEWNDPKPLSRAWCLWEMVSSVNTRSNLQVLMSPKNHEAFAIHLQREFRNIVFKTCSVNLKHAQAFNPSDRDSIFKAVEATAGFEEVNKQVIGIMREWMAQSGREALARLPQEERAFSELQGNLAMLLHDQGKLDEAEALLRQHVAKCRLRLGDTHANTLANLNRLALLLGDRYQERTEEEEEILRAAVEEARLGLGEDDPNTIIGLANLGMMLSGQSRFEEAESFCRKALDGARRTKMQGSDLYSAMGSLGSVLESQGKLDEADSLLTKALAGNRQLLGFTHPSTLGTATSMASLRLKQRKLEEAEQLYKDVWQARRRTLGDGHFRTLNSQNNLACFYFNEGMLQESEPHFKEAMEGCRKSLGNDHPFTLHCVENVGKQYHRSGRYIDAEPYYRESLEGSRRLLGENHPTTLEYSRNLDYLLDDIKNYGRH